MANWDPSALGALDRLRWHFLDSASVTAASGKASKVANKGSIGTAGDLAQATSTRYPAYSGGVLTTDGSQTYLLTSAIAASSIFANLQTGIFYGIVRYISNSVWFNMEISGGGANRFGAEGSARVDWPGGNNGTTSVQGFSPNFSTSRVFVVQKTTTNLTVWINGTQVASIANANKNTNGTAALGIGAQNSGNFPGAAEFKGAFGCIDDASLDTVQRVTGWLAWMMSDAGDSSYVAALPADHPYKAAAPQTAGGGTSYNDTLLEAGSATDAASTAAVYGASLTEALTASDSATAVASLAATQSEPASASDLVSTGGAVAASLAESLSASDAVTGTAALSALRTEPASASDTVSGATTFLAALTEAVAASDIVVTGAAMGAVSEAVTASDLATGTATFSASLAEAASAADTVAGSLSGAAVLAEPAAASDLVAGGGAVTLAIAESVTATDAVAAGTISIVALFEAGSAGDAISYTYLPNPYPYITPDVLLAGTLTGPVTLQGQMQPDLIILQARLR